MCIVGRWRGIFYTGNTYVGAIKYANDIVLVSTSAYAMRQMLAICDTCAGLMRKNRSVPLSCLIVNALLVLSDAY